MRRRLPPLLIALGLVLVACGDGDDGGSASDAGGEASTDLTVALATSDVYVGAPQRIAVGLVLGDQRLLSFGSVDVAFGYVGTAEERVELERGPSAVAVYLPTPGTPDEPGGPVATLPSEARGVYQAEDVTFDHPGFWQLDVTTEVDGLGVLRGTTTVPVLEDPRYPAPGEPALETENLTVDSEDTPLGAIDSRAANEGEVPDPELHEWTIARALEEGRPALVVFSTPVYCASQFCGPVTDVVAGLASRFDDRAVFIHVEIWHDYQNQELNRAAADWLFRDENLTEPWVYLIGPDGTILDRWATLFREAEVVAALEALPRMRA